jgi:hypothetical protein
MTDVGEDMGESDVDSVSEGKGKGKLANILT